MAEWLRREKEQWTPSLQNFRLRAGLVLKAALIRPAHKAPRPVVTVPPATQLIAADAGAPKEPATVM